MRLRLTTLLQFLAGRKQAIEEIAGNRKALLAGFLFCISAALARHYDGRYLVREPWFVLAPVGASILTSSILFAAMYFVGTIKARRILPGYVPAYLSFLTLYWMTAPLAWLYGIPYERFLSEHDAAQANVWTLELVSLWRLLLMSRVFSVLTPSSLFSAFSKLGTFALALVYAAVVHARIPLIDFMGGVRVPPSAEPVASAYMFVIIFGFFALIIGGIVVLGSLFIERPDWSLKAFQRILPGTVGRELPVLALIVILVFSAAMPATQREQRWRYQVEAAYKTGNIEETLTILGAHSRAEFPPQWTPPPWPEYEDGARDPKLVQIVQALQSRQNVHEWVTAVYREKASLYLHHNNAVPEPARTLLQAFAGEQSSIESSTVPSQQGEPSSHAEPGKVSLRVEFANPHRSFIALETTLGAGECSSNPVLYAQKLDGDAGWALTAFAKDNDRLCYRTGDLNGVGSEEWHEVKREKRSQTEAYQVTLP